MEGEMVAPGRNARRNTGQEPHADAHQAVLKLVTLAIIQRDREGGLPFVELASGGGVVMPGVVGHGSIITDRAAF